MITAFQSIETVTQMGCSQRIHVTPSAYSVCKKADFLTEDGRKGTKEGKKVPRVGVVSVPGAGSHWIRTLFQKMSGIYSGSCYYAQESRKYGLMGEFKPWQSNTTTFIKSHEIEGWSSSFASFFIRSDLGKGQDDILYNSYLLVLKTVLKRTRLLIQCKALNVLTAFYGPGYILSFKIGKNSKKKRFKMLFLDYFSLCKVKKCN